MTRRAVAAWCFYDWGFTASHAVIDTFIFSVYFTRSVAPTPEIGTAVWSHAVAVGGLLVALSSPPLGAIADRAGRRKPWIAVFTALSVLALSALFLVTPEPGSMTFCLVLMTAATLVRELAFVFFNAMLPDLGPPERLGRISGWGWAMGYAGGLACLVVALYGLVKADAPLFGLLSKDQMANVRAVGPLTALWFGLFALPLFLWTPDRPSNGIGWRQAAREGVATLAGTLRHIRRHRNLVWFLVASALYRDGLTTLVGFGGIYAAGTFGMSFQEILIFAIGLNVTAGLGATAFAWIDDAIGARTTILITLVGLTAFSTGVLLVHDKGWFMGLALGLGTFMGPAQSAGRSLLARMAPPDMVAECFGLYSLSGRAAAFMGPLALGWATAAFDSQRAGMATILAFFLAGFALMLGVREPGREKSCDEPVSSHSGLKP